MEFYIARQPIFNRDMEVVAYELLYRSSMENYSHFVDGDSATLDVINNTTLSLDFSMLTNGKPGFINFTHKLICDEIPTLFSPKAIVVEVLEDVKPDVKLIMAIGRLREKGYSIALDDFVLNGPHRGIVNIADIIKVDFILSTHEERERIIREHSDGRIKFLAEKVETKDEFEKAVEMGYTYFQGYFFAKPVVVKGKDVKAFGCASIQLFKEISKDDPNFMELSKIIETDLSLSYKLLKMANSPAFQTVESIKNINQAIVRLGQTELRKWVTVVMLQHISDDKPDEILSQSLIRAKLTEAIVGRTGRKDKLDEAFMIGLFSLIDVIMDRPLEEILAELPLSDEIKDAILGKGEIAGMISDLISSYEKAEWNKFEKSCAQHRIDPKFFFMEYYRSIVWAMSVFRGDTDENGARLTRSSKS